MPVNQINEVNAWISVATLGLIVGLLMWTNIAADLLFVGGLAVLLAFGVLTPAAALEGFANEGVATVGALYIVVAGLKETGGIHWLSQQLLGKPSTITAAQTKVMLPVTFLSAFLNNTPVVAMLIPAISDWSKKFNLPVSKLMLPLSYAAILGGTCTLIGTSTNLVVNGLLLKRNPADGMGMFELGWVGVPTAIIGVLFILLTSRWLLPDRRSAMSQLNDPREYSVEMLVDSTGPLVGKSIEEAGLRHLTNLYLAEIDRNGQLIPAVNPTEILVAGDTLVFIGVVESVVELQRIRGLTPATNQVFKLDVPRTRRVLIEAVVSDTFPLLNRNIREGRFRSRYDAVVIAVARNGVRLKQKIGDIKLRPGDTLLVEAGGSFTEQQRNSKDFFLVSAIEDSTPLQFDKIFVALGILFVMVVAAGLGFNMLKAALIAAALMLLTRCLRGSAARRSIDWSVLVVVAAAFGLGNALTSTGAAGVIANGLTGFANGSPHLALALIYIATVFFSSVITNNAAAVLMFPLAIALSNDMQTNSMPFIVAIMMGASASFATPVGYQTNLMVYGPGGYRFSDYLRIGVPLNIIAATVAIIVIPLVWTFDCQ